MPRHKLTKKQQIKGLRKALANPKTPNAFVPSMKKRLAKLLALVLLFLTSNFLLPTSSFAQFLGYTTPQSVQQTLASGANCTAANQNYTVINLGQTQHSAILTVSGSAQKLAMQILGTDSSGNTFPISTPAVTPAVFTLTGFSVVLNASGYYPKVFVQVNCAPNAAGTYTLTYSGTSSTPNVNNGSSLISQLNQNVFFQTPGNVNQFGPVVPSPFGNSSGTLAFTYISSPVANGVLTTGCTSIDGLGISVYTFTLQNTTALQVFSVPPGPCPLESVNYTSGGAAGNITLDYSFNPPGTGVNTTLAVPTHVTGTGATSAKANGGTLVSLTVNTPAAGTISIFDLSGTNCTGTPSTNTIAVITATATAPFGTFAYNSNFLNGICVKASVAMDFTVSTQ